ncbi:MAG TPA: ABC transporter permease, partial [Dietzia sp.]|nr:ABC transporter permease [Dietzia sp.]
MTVSTVASRPRRTLPWPAVGMAALVVALVASVFVGAADITAWDVATGGLTEAPRVYLVEARLPRTAAAALAGA